MPDFFARAGGMFIGAVLMWDILFRGQFGFSVSFLEEMWSRNLSNLMISPLRPIEFVCALMTMSVIRLAIGMVPVTLLAIGVLRLQPLQPGLRAGGVLHQPDPDELGGRHRRGGRDAAQRHGRGEPCLDADVRAACRSPASTIPVSVLPDWLQTVAWMLPPTYVFEGMRALILQHVFRADLMLDGLRAQRALLRRGGDRVSAACSRVRAAIGSLLQTGE